jgi:dolichyl-phosphate-mannose-protein mannosyltransferase
MVRGNSPPDSDSMQNVSQGTMKPNRVKVTAFTIGVLSLALFMAGISKPSATFYDELQYVSSARAFLAGAPNPNPEAPPLGKLLIAVGIKAMGDNPSGWRITGAVCGALTLMAILLWCHLLLHDYVLALTACALTLFNNFLFVMSRVAMMDVFLVMFIMWGLVAFTAALELNGLSAITRRFILGFAGAMFGLACACKWNGIDTLGIVIGASAVLLLAAKRSVDDRIVRYRTHLLEVGILPLIVALFVVPVVAYSLTYWPLCSSLHRPFTIGELLSMNLYIWRFHLATPGNKAIASPWYTWLFAIDPQRGLSYLVGNFIVMWGGLLALAFCARRFWKSFPEALVLVLYAGNLLQWGITPCKSTFYYYYYPAAMFLGVAIALALRHLPERVLGMRPAFILVLASAVFFLFCYPRMAHLDAPWDCAFGCWS